MASLCGERQIASACRDRAVDIPVSHRRRAAFFVGTATLPIAKSGDTRSGASMKKDTFRIVTRGTDGQILIRDYDSEEALHRRHTQIGVDDCSTDLDLRGLPVFRGLIGPIPEGANIIRYESPEVFETLTKQWTVDRPQRRPGSRSRARVPQ
jgi:hypothetical protein